MMPQLVSYHLEGRRSELLQLWNRSILKVTRVIIPLTFLFLINAQEIIVLLYTERYITAAGPFMIYTVIILHRVASYSAILKAVGDTRLVEQPLCNVLA